MVVRISDKTQNYSKVTKLLVKPNLIKQHTTIGQDILKDITIIPHIDEVTRSHHEHYDGTGYPDGLKGNEIPIQARIIALADSYDAMNSRRIYRNALSHGRIYHEIQMNAGTQFDPEITKVFLKLMDNGSLFHLEHEILPSQEDTINKFISDVVTTMQDQEETKNIDYLTGLPVRNVGQKRIASAMQKTNGCLIFLDMDNLKKINDVYGHKAGDRALKSLGKLLLDISIPKIACRMGGDEFLLFLPQANTEQAENTVSNVIEQFKEIIKDDSETHFAALSAGMLMCTRNDTFADAYSKADKALYYVKQNGKNNYSWYNQIHYGNTANFADIKLIKDSYKNLKNKLGRIPTLMDFETYGEIDVQRIFDNKSLGSYYAFLKKYEKDYKIRLNELEENFIKFICTKLANGKRKIELETLKDLINDQEYTFSNDISQTNVLNLLVDRKSVV